MKLTILTNKSFIKKWNNLNSTKAVKTMSERKRAIIREYRDNPHIIVKNVGITRYNVSIFGFDIDASLHTIYTLKNQYQPTTKLKYFEVEQLKGYI
jgi:hypothetical protein